VTAALDELGRVLRAEAAHLRKLLPLLERERQALLQGDASAVGDLAAEKAAIAQALAGLERVRRDVTARLAAALPVSAGAMPLPALLGALPEASPALRALVGELRGLLAGVAQANRRNGSLAERGLALFRGLLAELQATMAPPPTYAASGRSRPAGPAAAMLDRQA
jgi:flagellar biosynthesis/type III secretory pathway chaperone